MGIAKPRVKDEKGLNGIHIFPDGEISLDKERWRVLEHEIMKDWKVIHIFPRKAK